MSLPILFCGNWSGGRCAHLNRWQGVGRKTMAPGVQRSCRPGPSRLKLLFAAEDGFEPSRNDYALPTELSCSETCCRYRHCPI